MTQALVCKKASKHCSQAMYWDGEHSTGSFGKIPRGKFCKGCPKSAPVLTPRVSMESIDETAVPRRSAALPPPCPAKDVPNDLSFRDLSSLASDSRFAVASLFAAASLIVLFDSLSCAISSSNFAFIAAIRAFSSSIFITSYTYTHTGVYATRAVGLKTQPTRTGFMPPVFGKWPLSARAR